MTRGVPAPARTGKQRADKRGFSPSPYATIVFQGRKAGESQSTGLARTNSAFCLRQNRSCSYAAPRFGYFCAKSNASAAFRSRNIGKYVLYADSMSDSFLPTGEHSSLCLAAIHESGHLRMVGSTAAFHGKPQRANTVRPYGCWIMYKFADYAIPRCVQNDILFFVRN